MGDTKGYLVRREGGNKTFLLAILHNGDWKPRTLHCTTISKCDKQKSLRSSGLYPSSSVDYNVTETNA